MANLPNTPDDLLMYVGVWARGPQSTKVHLVRSANRVGDYKNPDGYAVHWWCGKGIRNPTYIQDPYDSDKCEKCLKRSQGVIKSV